MYVFQQLSLQNVINICPQMCDKLNTPSVSVDSTLTYKVTDESETVTKARYVRFDCHQGLNLLINRFII